MNIKDTFVKRNAPYALPYSLIKQLYNLDDGRLRIRWSERKEKWILERKVACGIQYIPNLPHVIKTRDGRMVENDSWIQARDGYIMVGTYDAQPMLGDWVIRNLQYFNIRRFGSVDAAEAELMRAERAEELSKENAARTENEAFAKDFLDGEQWRQGCRASVPSNYNSVI